MLCFLFVLCFQIQLQREAVNGKNPKCAASHIFFSSFVSHYSPIITSSVNGCDALLLSLLCISFNLFTAIIGADNWLFPLCSSTPFYRIYFPRTYVMNPKNRNTFKIESGPNSSLCLFPKLVQGVFPSKDSIENQRLVRSSSCYPLAFYWRVASL